MSITLALQIAIATMGALSAILLGMGERQVLLPFLAVVIAACAVYFNDLKSWVRLSDSAANAVCLLAGGIAAWELAQLGRERQLLAATNLLVYLQFILLFQHKSERRYWMLALLSLMQVSVAAALGLDLSFGLLMLCYFVVSLTALVLFCAQRETARYSGVTNGSEPVSLARSKRTLRAATICPAAVRGPHPIFGNFSRLVCGMAGSALLVAVVLFVLIPRLEQQTWARRGGTGGAVTGVPESVSLAEVGTIYESPEVVMRVQFIGPDGDYYRLREPPLFRGFHLSYYRNNRWQQGEDSHPVGLGTTKLTLASDMVLQEIDARASDSNVLFHVAWSTTTSETGGLLWDEPRQRMLRGGNFRSTDSHYRLVNKAFANGQQHRFTPANWLDEGGRYYYTDFPQSLQRLQDLSRRLVADVDPGDTLARIRKLEGYLTDPRRFSYTLRPKQSDRTIDAVEDFLFNTRQGHCEYYASALTLMLRSLEIPARMVVGYKGGELNTFGSFYQVRQLHAHAWVEAYMRHDDLPKHVLAHHGDWKFGAWYTIDPTPSTLADSLEATTRVRLLSLRQIADYARFLWSSYVMGMDAQRQQQSIYSFPLETVGFIADSATWRALGDWLALFFVPGRDPSSWFGWVYLRLAVAVAVGSRLIISGIRYLRRHWSTWSKWLFPSRNRAPAAPRAETLLFGRLERALAQHDFHRPEGQTPREFALAAGGLLSGSRATQHIAQLPLHVVESFYRIRFSGRGRDRGELELLEQSLARLETALAPANLAQGAKGE